MFRLGWGARPSIGRQKYSTGTKNPYDVLGLHRSAKKKEIKDAYIRLSKIYHPDKNVNVCSTSEYQDIRTAYDTLIALPDTQNQEGKENEPGTGRGPPGTGSGPRRTGNGPRGTGYGGYSGYYTDPLNDFNRNDEFWSRREKARTVDDWVKNVERNARIRKKMSNRNKSQNNDHRDSFSGYYEKRGRADGPEGPDYGPEGRFSGPQSHKDMFYGPLARKHDQKFIQMVDRAFELYRTRLMLGGRKNLSERLFDLHAYCYFLFLRWFLRIGTIQGLS
ncbi:uncharacterized protein LOC111716083 isoform X2 [Eurytemora carolleeae]|uniref:uncharacterized protein LOC111716083 isoform X2 n=1 Tax=Eurytemora carolleeae TaxID=1294199 RepID=UPI000C777AD6|nr:uncharacterized protein LOC111716083 isoform X2 [Eurytemora carolleeae]|eukprot:XP_023347264.1 uncharacterized protein LOC111716083 isoform X2 [Eurytemora affinis]